MALPAIGTCLNAPMMASNISYINFHKQHKSLSRPEMDLHKRGYGKPFTS